MNDPQEAFRRFAKQVQRAGGPGGGPPKGAFAGAGLLIALVGGGLALNASIFNGTSSLAHMGSSDESVHA